MSVFLSSVSGPESTETQIGTVLRSRFAIRKTKTRIVNANTGVTRHGSADIAILMLSGLRDTIVPPSHMRELWEIVRPNAKAVYSPCLVVPEDECGGEVEDSGYATVSSRRSAGWSFHEGPRPRGWLILEVWRIVDAMIFARTRWRGRGHGTATRVSGA